MAQSMVPKFDFHMRWCQYCLRHTLFSCSYTDSMALCSMIFLFRSGTVREKLALIFRATKTHAQNLAKYATVYKLTMLLLKHMGSDSGKEGPYDTFFSGLLGGYLVFGRRSKRGNVSSVSKQIVIFGKGIPISLWNILTFYSFRPRLSCLSKTFNRTFHRDNKEPRIIEKDSTRCLAGFCGIKLGFSHVAVQVVS